MKQFGVLGRVLLPMVTVLLLVTLFTVALASSEDSEDDVARYTQAIEENPQDAAAYNSRGNAYWQPLKTQFRFAQFFNFGIFYNFSDKSVVLGPNCTLLG